MVETARLESVLALTGYEGSNPSFSAIHFRSPSHLIGRLLLMSALPTHLDSSHHGGVYFKIGVLLILSSFLPWLVLPVAAWFAPTPGDKAAGSGALLVFAEVLFWSGTLLSGRDVWAAVKSAGWKKVIPELLKRLQG